MSDVQKSVIEAALDGVEAAVQLQEELEWHFSRTRPEYLLTVEVARALIEHHRKAGYTEEWKLFLECPTRRVVAEIVAGGNRLVKNLKISKRLAKGLSNERLFRAGRVDILASHNPDGPGANDSCYVVELKGTNPSTTEIRKEVTRIGMLLEIGGEENRLTEGLITFVWKAEGPRTTPEKRERDLRKSLDGACKEWGVSIRMNRRSIKTKTDPDDGTPEVHGFCLCVSRAA